MSVEKDLDLALAGRPTDDAEIGSLLALARELDRSLTLPLPSWSRERALFVAGVTATRRGPRISRFLIPALALILAVVVGFAGRIAVPGDTLYPVRKALQRFGLATSPLTDVDENIARATRRIAAAESALSRGELASAEENANAAIAILDSAFEELEILEGEDIESRILQITALLDLAEEVIALVERAEDTPDPADRGPEPARKGDDDEGEEGDDGDDDDGDDDDGAATDGGDDGGDDDNSGPGGGDDGNGGPGGDDGETLGDDTDNDGGETLDDGDSDAEEQGN